MKLLKVLSVAALGTLLAVGCTVTTTETSGDGGTTGADTGVKDTGSTGGDTGGAKDSGPATDTGGGTETCEACQTRVTGTGGSCEAELKACSTSAASAGCKALIDCINACTDATCANKCISDSTSTEGKAFVNCIFSECATACGG